MFGNDCKVGVLRQMVELLTLGSGRVTACFVRSVSRSRCHFTRLRTTMAFLLILLACLAGPLIQVAQATITVDQFVANPWERQSETANASRS